MNPGLASWVPLRLHSAGHGTPQTVVVIGATGMAGGLAVQNAQALGARHIIAIGRGPQALEYAATLGATTVALTGDAAKDTAAFGSALGDQAPDLVLDFLWGSPAESMFRAVEGTQPADFTGYVQIGSLAGSYAGVPASLLRSRPFRLTGSGIGSISMTDYVGQVPVYMQLIADGTVEIRTRRFSLSQVSEAWAAAQGPRPVLATD
jgi:threonine dehydrogenase-like Zn-dependent dehydrogenase